MRRLLWFFAGRTRPEVRLSDIAAKLFFFLQRRDARIIMTACYEDKARLILCYVRHSSMLSVWFVIAPDVQDIRNVYPNEIIVAKYSPQCQKTYLQTSAPSEDSDQPAHSRRLIRIFTERIWIANDETLLYVDNAHVRMYVFSRCDSPNEHKGILRHVYQQDPKAYKSTNGTMTLETTYEETAISLASWLQQRFALMGLYSPCSKLISD